MSAKQFDSRTADKFVARLPDGLRGEIEAIATASNRSMNAVFVQAVREYTDGQKRQQLLLDALANAVALTTAVADAMHIDDRVRMAADARRYRWLRDVAATTGSGHAPMVKVAGGPGRWRVGDDLDQSIDQAMKCWPAEQEDATCA